MNLEDGLLGFVPQPNLRALVARMPPRVLRARSVAVVKARAWMVNVSNAGGIGPVSKTFKNPGSTKGERIDVEVRQGKAFVP